MNRITTHYKEGDVDVNINGEYGTIEFSEIPENPNFVDVYLVSDSDDWDEYLGEFELIKSA